MAGAPQPLADQAARDRIASDFDVTMIVEAAAGTGKTTALVRRIVSAITAGRSQLDHIVAVTFTELAAGELKLRLRTEIERARAAAAPGSPAARRLVAAVPQLEEARIGTIHSFCADLLRERPVEARGDPLFEVAPEDVSSGLLRRAFDRWFEEQLAAPTPGVRRVLRRVGERGTPRDLLLGAAEELVRWRDFPTPWKHQSFAREGEIDTLVDEMTRLGEWAARGDPDDFFTKSLAAIEQRAAEIRRREAVRERDYDGLEAELSACVRDKHWRWTGYTRSAARFPKAELRARRDELLERLRAFGDAAGADLAPRLRDELWPIVERYEHLKERAGKLDFLDLLLLARNLLRDNAEVRRGLQDRFTHIYVDEFQDTDPLQAEILLLLAADDAAQSDWTVVRPVPGKLFLVGDPKQSIYRFRRADVGLYEAVKRRLVEGGAALEHLTVSFRAVPEIQHAVNAAFALRMGGASPHQADYVPLAPFRPSCADQPSVIALPVPAPYGDYGKIVDWKIDESLPDAMAAFVDWLVRESGWTVTERERPSERVPIAPRHICLLFRRFRTFGDDVTRRYVRALEARHLPHVLVGGGAFHEREEVEAIRNALAAIERPDDELMLFATLRGPLFAFGDAALLAFRERFSSLHPFRRLTDDLPPALAEVADALAILRDLHRERNRRTIAETIVRLLDATRAHAGFAIWPTGEQALANVTRLIDLARRAERAGVTSFRAFVERLFDEAERGEASDAPIIEEGTGGVRLMTVHRAKGLEFPIVLLADLTAKEAPAEPTRFTDPLRHVCAMRLVGCLPPELLERREEEQAREREEAARILYVAATRARDLLVVPAAGDERREGWLAALHPVIYPEDGRRRQPESAAAPGCPRFERDTVGTRPPRAPGRERAVAPGMHRAEAGSHRVVWWDPSALTLGVEESVGLRQQKLLEADERGVRAEEGVEAHAAWQAWRRGARLAGGEPSVRAEAVTERAAAVSAAPEAFAGAGGVELGSSVAVERVPRRRDRPRGVRFGTLVHALLAAVELDADRRAVEAMATLQARALGATAEERAAAAEAVVRALDHPVLRRAAAAAAGGKCRRETPIAIHLDDGTLLEGVVDLAFVDPSANARGDAGAVASWIVVDFKTDTDLEPRLTEYRTQVALYALAIARATGAQAHPMLLQV